MQALDTTADILGYFPRFLVLIESIFLHSQSRGVSIATAGAKVNKLLETSSMLIISMIYSQDI